MKDVKIYSDGFAKKYTDKRDEYSLTDKFVIEELKKIGLLNKNVLDIGCGDGRHVKILKELGANKVIGIDNSSAMISLARKNSSHDYVEYVEADINKLPIKDSSQDLAFSNFVIHHIVNLETAFKEVFRVLKKDGFFVFTFNIFETTKGDLYNTEVPLKLGKDIVVINLVKKHSEVKEALATSGFQIESYQTLDSSYLSIDQSYERKNDILDIKNILCIAKKK